MANRRKFLAGLGALASGSAAAVGTGAFTSVTANRSVTVSVEGDQDAYLGMDAEGSTNGAYADESGDDGELSIDFGDISSGDDLTETDGGSGVNPSAVTKARDVFQITNQGTQEVEVDLSGGTNISTTDPSSPSAGSDDIHIYFNESGGGTNVSTGSKLTGSASDIELAPGDKVQVDVTITTDSDTSFESVGDLTVSANAGDVNDSADDSED